MRIMSRTGHPALARPTRGSRATRKCAARLDRCVERDRRERHGREIQPSRRIASFTVVHDRAGAGGRAASTIA
jgi:hypothetical protein